MRRAQLTRLFVLLASASSAALFMADWIDPH